MNNHHEIVRAHENIDGFLKHRSEWNEDVASQIAEKEGLNLSRKHWDVIHFIRTEFYANNGILPLEDDIKDCMTKEWNSQVTDLDLTTLFPGGSSTQGAKIAGCITMTTVKDLISIKGTTVWSIKPDQTVVDALRILSEKNIGALMVVDNEKLVGVMSERDFTRDVVLSDKHIEETRVIEIMSNDVVSVSLGDTLDQCMELMIDRGFRHLPVLDNDKLAGVISMPDLVRVIVEQQQSAIARLQDNDRGRTMASN